MVIGLVGTLIGLEAINQTAKSLKKKRKKMRL
jgi:hypothetical protein